MDAGSSADAGGRDGGLSDGSSPTDEMCVLDSDQIQVMRSQAGIEFVRTPDACFEGLVQYPFDANYVEVDGGMRMHYVEAGPANGPVFLLLHGQPSWSYLYRKMIPVLAEAGFRVIAPDNIGMGRSDKPTDPEQHRFEQHVTWTKSFMDALSLQDVNLFAQDWGSIIGLRVAGDNPERFDRIVIANGNLVVIDSGANPFMKSSFQVDPSLAGLDYATFLATRTGSTFQEQFQQWIDYAGTHPDLLASQVLEELTVVELSMDEEAAYDAPYPGAVYKAAIRAFPGMIADIELENAAADTKLNTFINPFLFLAGELDTNLGSVENQQRWMGHVPGAAGQDHRRYPDAHHFIQEDVGAEIAQYVAEFADTNPTGETPAGGGPLFHLRYCEIIFVVDEGPPAVSQVWGTIGLNTCPQERWDAIDFDVAAMDQGASRAIPNGPRFFIGDQTAGGTPSSGEAVTTAFGPGQLGFARQNLGPFGMAREAPWSIAATSKSIASH
ncbi:MAG: haloalkane dehalogenase, partial [Myxococcota bacterium]